jgi:hypothetical protein
VENKTKRVVKPRKTKQTNKQTISGDGNAIRK